ncbi:MAG TPA: hypothetical protein VJZ02_01540 [Candidatus Brocadiales bacterium]|nr:hypothetical protein [Candidatus Brocadiales bacterium]
MTVVSLTPVIDFTGHPSGDGFGHASETVSKLLKSALGHLKSRSQLNLLLAALEGVFKDCSEPNWDGYNALPISYEAYRKAEKLLTLLPISLPMPEIGPEPTGEIGLEWYTEKQFVFAISVGGNNIITYAGIFGEGNTTHGTEVFTESIPSTILRNIRRLF